ncbi:MAG TPA: Gfo/Idh/MocA family oxidoreductase [Bryobacteraceae bacterium]|nr:Gfo/Idh/MocA family oxidoreductase [Bryobacteraceae bacterium]
MKTKFKTALFGTGFVGRVHLETMARLGYIDVRALGTADTDQAQRLAAEFGVGRVESDYRRILDDREIDAVHICTPNSLHAVIARDALEAGKHVLCEKPLATSAEDARQLVALASQKKLRNCTCHNLRFYPLVQQMRRMREDGELGEILVLQGTYFQDWLLLDTDWNWRLDSKDNGPSRAMADIGSHWCDMAEHVTGLRITALCADLQTFHRVRKQPKGRIQTFAGKMLTPDSYQEVLIDTEDFGAVVFRMGDRARGSFSASQVSAGRKNRLNIEVCGTKASVAWDQERPNELWIGKRETPNQVLIKDPALLESRARSFADLPGGHAEGYGDTFKQVFRRFYRSIEDHSAAAEYPQFADGLRQLTLVESELESSRKHAWVEVRSA